MSRGDPRPAPSSRPSHDLPACVPDRTAPTAAWSPEAASRTVVGAPPVGVLARGTAVGVPPVRAARPGADRCHPGPLGSARATEGTMGTHRSNARGGTRRPHRAAAFFDLDKTIIATSSATAFSRPFLAGGLLTRRAILRSAYAQFLYLVGGADASQTERLRAQLSRTVTGWDVAQVSEIVERTLHESIDAAVYACLLYTSPSPRD